MASTRFNYDPCRTTKILQESTGPGRYMLDTPGNGCTPCFMEDPEIRLQKWGANLRKVPGGHPIDINSDLLGITRTLTKDCVSKEYPKKGVVISRSVKFANCKPYTQQSRATNPAWMYRDLEQVDWWPLILNPQENVCMHFQNNLNTRLLEKDYYVSKVPCPILR
jgi:hypothetical protein